MITIEALDKLSSPRRQVPLSAERKTNLREDKNFPPRRRVVFSAKGRGIRLRECNLYYGARIA